MWKRLFECLPISISSSLHWNKLHNAVTMPLSIYLGQLDQDTLRNETRTVYISQEKQNGIQYLLKVSFKKVNEIVQGNIVTGKSPHKNCPVLHLKPSCIVKFRKRFVRVPPNSANNSSLLVFVVAVNLERKVVKNRLNSAHLNTGIVWF